jgi:hypothetical protein
MQSTVHNNTLHIEYQPTALVEDHPAERAVVEGALNLIAHDSVEHGIGVERVTVKRHFSPEEESDEFVLTLYVQTDPEAALDYWLSLADTIAQWTASLPQPYGDLARERIAIAVRSIART